MHDAFIRSLDWLGANASRFTIDGGLTRKALKPALELGIMVHALQRPGGAFASRGSVLPTALHDVFASLAARDDVRLAPLRRIGDLLLHTIIDVVLRDAGRSNPIGLAPARAALRAGVSLHEELLGYLRLEERMFLDWAGLDHDLPPAVTLVAGSMLSRQLSALRLSEATAYQLTHDIMFLGALDPANPAYAEADLDRANLGEVLADLMIVFANVEHWDLLGELLLCWDCLHLPQGDLYHRSWSLMIMLQDADGSVPGPPSRPGRPKPAETPATRFNDRYHTTLVLALMLDAQARRDVMAAHPLGRTPPVRPAATLVYDAARDLAWLTRLLDRADDFTPAMLCGVLVGAQLCGVLDPALADEVSDLGDRIAIRLARATEIGGASPALLLVAFAIMRSRGDHAPILERYADQVRDILNSLPIIEPKDDLSFCEKRVLLHQIGLTPMPRLLTVGDACRAIVALPIRPDPDAFTQALLAVESACGHGVHAPTGGTEAASLLSRHAVRLLRRGDLMAGCSAVRAAHHLGPLSPARSNEFALDLLLRQAPEGGYGHLVTSDPVPFDRDLQLHLPTTLAVLWTLAELRPGFSLYESLAPAAQDATLASAVG